MDNTVHYLSWIPPGTYSTDAERDSENNLPLNRNDHWSSLVFFIDLQYRKSVALQYVRSDRSRWVRVLRTVQRDPVNYSTNVQYGTEMCQADERYCVFYAK